MARTVILGAGGHARALANCLTDTPVFVDDDDAVEPGDLVYIGVGDIATRRRLYARFRAQIPLRGVQYMQGVIVGANVTLGVNVLLNTGCQVDHDCIVGDHCVISPGAILCGGVKLGTACVVGAGAIILEGVELEPETFVPAGTLVVGPDDFRKPVRMVRRDGADEAQQGAQPVP